VWGRRGKLRGRRGDMIGTKGEDRNEAKGDVIGLRKENL
jgi:hypothetical protein